MLYTVEIFANVPEVESSAVCYVKYVLVFEWCFRAEEVCDRYESCGLAVCNLNNAVERDLEYQEVNQP